jgi:hypothetical protein
MELQVRQDDRFRRRERVVQRVAWVLIVLFIAAGLLGVFGPGPLSWSTAASEDGAVTVEYQRFGHLEADDLVTITVAGAAVASDSVEVELAAEWVAAVDLQSIVPQPDMETSTADGLLLEVAAQPGSPVTIQITYRASTVGPIDGAARLDEATASFDQLIYP